MIKIEDRRTISGHGQANKENGVTVRVLMQMCEVGTLTHIKFAKVVSSIMGRKILVRGHKLNERGPGAGSNIRLSKYLIAMVLNLTND